MSLKLNPILDTLKLKHCKITINTLQTRTKLFMNALRIMYDNVISAVI